MVGKLDHFVECHHVAPKLAFCVTSRSAEESVRFLHRDRSCSLSPADTFEDFRCFPLEFLHLRVIEHRANIGSPVGEKLLRSCAASAHLFVAGVSPELLPALSVVPTQVLQAP